MEVLVYTKNGKGETTYKRTVEVKPTVRAIRALFRKHEEGMDFESRLNFGDNSERHFVCDNAKTGVNIFDYKY
jgi:hypothetical protein